MQPILTPITGEEGQGELKSPFEALVQFYYAFNHRDMGAMADNWARSEDSAMDNPLGGIRRGWSEIRQVYEKIFSGPARVYVEYYDYTVHETPEIFYAVGRERGYFRLGDKEVTLAIRTTRIFRKVSGSWKQVHHHGSIESPELLAQYRSAVMNSQQ